MVTVERVRTAIRGARFDKDLSLQFTDEYAEAMARAAISAYHKDLEERGLVIVPRVPTGAMLRARHETPIDVGWTGDADTTNDLIFAAEWRATIEAATEEGNK